MTKRSTKAEETAELVAAAIGAGRRLHLPSVDFADPNRPKTCLEVDVPILPVNQIAQSEGNAGKPVYQMSEWWARRRSSVFRAMLIAAATRALKLARVAIPGGAVAISAARGGVDCRGCLSTPRRSPCRGRH